MQDREKTNFILVAMCPTDVINMTAVWIPGIRPQSTRARGDHSEKRALQSSRQQWCEYKLQTAITAWHRIVCQHAFPPNRLQENPLRRLEAYQWPATARNIHLQ